MHMEQSFLVSGFAIVVGALLVLEGICEQFTPVLFGVLTSNALHGAVHILLGLAGIFTGLRGGARNFCLFLGFLLLAVDLLWFIPATNGSIVGLLAINQPVAIMNLIVALASLAVAFSSSCGRASQG